MIRAHRFVTCRHNGRDDLLIIQEKEAYFRIVGLRMESENYTSQPMTLADDGFDMAVERYDLMVVDFWAPWCGPCMAMAPVIEELSEEYADRVIFGKLNTDENPSTTERFGIMGIPTLLFLHGGTEVERIVGAVPKQEIRNVIDRLLGPS